MVEVRLEACIVGYHHQGSSIAICFAHQELVHGFGIDVIEARSGFIGQKQLGA
jgi:anthranilate/para-aminobenzoate synthase component II